MNQTDSGRWSYLRGCALWPGDVNGLQPPIWPLLHIELDGLAFSQAAEALRRDVALRI